MYNLPLKENTKSNYNEHFTTDKNRLQEGKTNGPPREEEEIILGLLITIVETK
jgi:hypothetical protein